MFKSSKTHRFIYLPFQTNVLQCSRNCCSTVRGLSPLLVARNTPKKGFVNVFAREMLPKCRVNVQIALKFSNLSIFFYNSRGFLKFFLMSKIPPQNSGIMQLSLVQTSRKAGYQKCARNSKRSEYASCNPETQRPSQFTS